MKKILKDKKICMAIIVVCVLILAGVIVGLVSNRDKDKSDASNEEQDVIVHEADKNTVEEIGEDGLIESDSEDGPVLSEDNMIDFNGDDAENGDEKDSKDGDKDGTDDDSNKDDSNKNDSNKNDSNKDDSDKDDSDKDNSNKDDSDKNDSNKEDDTKDTGSWGTIY